MRKKLRRTTPSFKSLSKGRWLGRKTTGARLSTPLVVSEQSGGMLVGSHHALLQPPKTGPSLST